MNSARRVLGIVAVKGRRAALLTFDREGRLALWVVEDLKASPTTFRAVHWQVLGRDNAHLFPFPDINTIGGNGQSLSRAL